MSHDIFGTWHNDHGSELRLHAAPDGALSGIFRPGVGFGRGEPFPITGYVSGRLLAFAVDAGKYGSLTSWVGHVVDAGQGERTLQTMWQMTIEVPHPQGEADLWKSVWTGADVFRPGPAPADQPRREWSPPTPLWAP